MTSICFSESTLLALSSLPPCPTPAIFGPAPPTFDVVKNTGSKCAKSPSACIRSIRTEPTIPRQPTRPTRFTENSLQPLEQRQLSLARQVDPDNERGSVAVPFEDTRPERRFNAG